MSGPVVPSYDAVSEQLLRLSTLHAFGSSSAPAGDSSALVSHSSNHGGETKVVVVNDVPDIAIIATFMVILKLNVVTWLMIKRGHSMWLKSPILPQLQILLFLSLSTMN